MAPPTIKRAPYKDFLQPALHRRFSTTASILLGVAYLQAIFLGNWNSLFWSWFPLGPAGIRTFFLFFCGLSIIILRIAQYHVGLRTSVSGFQTFVQNALKMQTLEALVSYTLSAGLFSLVYLLSASESAHLSWITYYSGDRARLSEKPLFFVVHFAVLGVVQGLLHLSSDADRLSLGVAARGRPGAQTAGDAAAQFKHFTERLPVLLIASGMQAMVMLIVSIPIYMLLLRGITWQTTLLFFRPFYNLPRTNMLPVSWPFSVFLLVRCILASFLLLFAWMAGNTAFSIFLVKEPLKNGRPLTTESKDPNGSLLNGLKSKKLAIKSFAMWELAFIARDFDARRKIIYEDIDRKDGPMWSQVYTICLDIVRSIPGRIDAFKNPAPVAPAAPPAQAVAEKQKTTQPLKNDPILVSTPPRRAFRNEVEKAVTQIALSPGQTSRLSPLTQKALAGAKDKLLAIQKEATGTEDSGALVRDLALKFLKTPLGIPFRQEYRRRLAAIVLGTPYGEPSLYINAVNALTLLAAHSLTEDKYGNVQRDVPTIIRTLTSVTKQLEAFKVQLPVHWTDVAGRKDSPEVDGVTEALKEGLAQLLQEFGPYSRDLGLSMADMRMAREAAGVPASEVAQI